jgi:hypothetical protein
MYLGTRMIKVAGAQLFSIVQLVWILHSLWLKAKYCTMKSDLLVKSIQAHS